MMKISPRAAHMHHLTPSSLTRSCPGLGFQGAEESNDLRVVILLGPPKH